MATPKLSLLLTKTSQQLSSRTSSLPTIHRLALAPPKRAFGSSGSPRLSAVPAPSQRRQHQQQRRTMASASSVPGIEHISTDKACPPAGPYSQAIRTPHAIYVSGQIPFSPLAQPVGGSIAVQTAAVIANIRAVLEAAGSNLDKVVKVNIFLADMGDFAAMNDEYVKHFTNKPARSCVAVKELPKGVPVEIECVALP
ncbi:MAG: hypothetical protein M1819_004090 [Sarea resinae]|nr:MAG: hypothetical protein M1819_004090 [Sarea resinae]